MKIQQKMDFHQSNFIFLFYVSWKNQQNIKKYKAPAVLARI